MDDSLMFDYMLQMGAMRPDEEELKRKQAMVEALRTGSLQGPEGQMIGKHYVAPSFTQNLAQVAQGYAAAKGQKGVDSGLAGMNERQRQMLEELRKRKQMGGMPAAPSYSNDPYSNLPTYGSGT